MKIISLLASMLILCASCATIVSDSEYEVHLKSSPPGATYRVEDQRTGELIAMGQTPANVTLDAGPEYFTRGKYMIYVSMKGWTPQKRPLKARIDGWYAGNLIFGGIIGFLLVDPLSGAMWKLPREVNVQLLPEGQQTF